MKKHFLIATALILVFFFKGSAQQEATFGRFIIGTSPLAFSINNNTSRYQYDEPLYGIQTDTLHSTGSSTTIHLNLFVGYFITKNVCAGLQFSDTLTALYSPFIRYYFFQKKPDSAKFDFFMEANILYSHSTTNSPYTDNVYASNNSANSTSANTSTQTTLYYSLGIATAYHLTKHWRLEAHLGFLYGTNTQVTGAYTSVNESNLSSNNPQYTTSSQPSLKYITFASQAFVKFALAYRL